MENKYNNLYPEWAASELALCLSRKAKPGPCLLPDLQTDSQGPAPRRPQAVGGASLLEVLPEVCFCFSPHWRFTI